MKPNRSAYALVALALTLCPLHGAKLAHQHRLGWIRVFYDTVGQHAVDAADVDHSGVPDQVEDIAKQTWASYLLFVEGLGFPDPFQSKYFGSATCLDIHLLHRSVLGANGIAYDEVQRFQRSGDPPGTLSLCFNVATSVKGPGNLTPAHEFFHLLQYSVTRFKNAWYSEGMARWSEPALGPGALGKHAGWKGWPRSGEANATLFALAYGAADQFWNPLAARHDPAGIIPESSVSTGLKELTYSTGAKVLPDLCFTGWELMRDVLAELGRVEALAFRELGYDRWSESNQNSEKNNPYILRAVRTVCERRGKRSNPEEK